MPKANNTVRVFCLYRVSSKKQFDKDKNDIPVQREACRSFVQSKTHENWQIIREECELGVSGYKVSAKQRDVIQDYLACAERGEFDVLLVFMFDRLGRIDDETPFVVEKFVSLGIQCWSVSEGQQRFDHHVDKLTNYIRYWQASGESEKLSRRTAAAKKQLIEQGLWPGGSAPLGYRCVHKGRMNVRGIPVKDIEIDPDMSAAIRQVIKWILYEGIGVKAAARRLNKAGVKNTHTYAANQVFTDSSLRSALTNKILIGYLERKKGNLVSPHIPELQIISDEEFNKLQKVLVKQRESFYVAKKHSTDEESTVHLVNLHCGGCGDRFYPTVKEFKRKTPNADGSYVTLREYYFTDHYKSFCRYYQLDKSKIKPDCCEPWNYTAEKVDNMVDEVIQTILEHLRASPKFTIVQGRLRESTRDLKASKKSKLQKLAAARRNLEVLEKELPKCLLGESAFTPEVLAGQIESTTNGVLCLESELEEIEAKLKSSAAEAEATEDEIQSFISWGEEYKQANHLRKRVIARELFDRIEIRRDYQLTFYIAKKYQFLVEPLAKQNEAIIADGERRTWKESILQDHSA